MQGRLKKESVVPNEVLKWLSDESGNSQSTVWNTIVAKDLGRFVTPEELEKMKSVCDKFKLPTKLLASNLPVFFSNDSKSLQAKISFLLRDAQVTLNELKEAPFLLERPLKETEEFFGVLSELGFSKTFVSETLLKTTADFEWFYRNSSATIRFYFNLLTEEYEFPPQQIEAMLRKDPNLFSLHLINGFVERKTVFDQYLNWKQHKSKFQSLCLYNPQVLFIPTDKLSFFVRGLLDLETVLRPEMGRQGRNNSKTSPEELTDEDKERLLTSFATWVKMITYGPFFGRVLNRYRGLVFYLSNDRLFLEDTAQIKSRQPSNPTELWESETISGNPVLFSRKEQAVIFQSQQKLISRFCQADPRNDVLALEAALLLQRSGEPDLQLSRLKAGLRNLREEYNEFIASKTNPSGPTAEKYEQFVRQTIADNLDFLANCEEFSSDDIVAKLLQNDKAEIRPEKFYRELWRPSENIAIPREAAQRLVGAMKDTAVLTTGGIMEKFGFLVVFLGMSEEEFSRFLLSSGWGIGSSFKDNGLDKLKLVAGVVRKHLEAKPAKNLRPRPLLSDSTTSLQTLVEYYRNDPLRRITRQFVIRSADLFALPIYKLEVQLAKLEKL